MTRRYIPGDTTDPRHGSNAGFHMHMNAGEDPCQPCRDGRAQREAENRAKRLAAGSFTHATHTAWDSGCRCDDCTTWHRALYRDYYERTSS